MNRSPKTLMNICAKKVRDIYTLQQIWGLDIPRMVKLYINMKFPWSSGEYYDYLTDDETPREMLMEIEGQTELVSNDPLLTYEYLLEYEYYEIFKDQRYCSSCIEYLQQKFQLNSLNVKHCKISYNYTFTFPNTVLNELDSTRNICTLCKYERLFTATKDCDASHF